MSLHSIAVIIKHMSYTSKSALETETLVRDIFKSLIYSCNKKKKKLYYLICVTDVCE